MTNARRTNYTYYNPIPQRSHNRDAAQVVDVVLDSRLSYHLRPHQREGVLFLYECVMGLRDFNGQGAILASVHTHICMYHTGVLTLLCSYC